MIFPSSCSQGPRARHPASRFARMLVSLSLSLYQVWSCTGGASQLFSLRPLNGSTAAYNILYEVLHHPSFLKEFERLFISRSQMACVSTYPTSSERQTPKCGSGTFCFSALTQLYSPLYPRGCHPQFRPSNQQWTINPNGTITTLVHTLPFPGSDLTAFHTTARWSLPHCSKRRH